jgi:predicted nuclease of predicted toxin-antitoxin system
VKFLIDMMLSPALAGWLRERGHDAIHAAEVDLARAPDTVIMERGLAEGRVILTADLDYPRLLALARAAAPGVILFRGGTFTEHEVRTRLGRVLERVPHEELARSIVVIEPGRIRRRPLPL